MTTANTYCSSMGYRIAIVAHYSASSDMLSQESRHSNLDAVTSVLESQRSEYVDCKALQLGIRAHLMSNSKSKAAAIQGKGAKCFKSYVFTAGFAMQ